VDRKSIDYRATVNTVYDSNFTPGDPTSNGGVSSSSFNTINFRMESETPGAVIKFGTLRGVANETAAPAVQQATYNNGGYTGDFTTWTTFPNTVTGLTINNIYFSMGSNTFANGGNPNSPTTTVNADPGTWIAPNLLRKSILGRFIAVNISGNKADNTNDGLHFYTMENGSLVKRQGMGNLQVYRTYNKDATQSDLDKVTLGPATGTAPREYAFSSGNSNQITTLRASKNYVIAQASVNHIGISPDAAATGYEGIFKTIVMLKNPGPRPNPDPTASVNDKPFDPGNKAVGLSSSNLANGSPSIAGFPVLMGSGDLRYTRVMEQYGTTNGTQLLWISTEIVSQAFFGMSSPQNSSSLMAQPWTRFGDSGANLTGGYGELTYSYQQM